MLTRNRLGRPYDPRSDSTSGHQDPNNLRIGPQPRDNPLLLINNGGATNCGRGAVGSVLKVFQCLPERDRSTVIAFTTITGARLVPLKLTTREQLEECVTNDTR